LSSPRELVERLEAGLIPSGGALREAGGAWLTGKELLEQVRLTARGLRAEGVGRGDLVLASGLRGRSLLFGLLGIWACDAAAAAVESIVAAPELEAIARQLNAAYLLERDPSGNLKTTKRPGRRRGALPAGTAMVKLTSGSTGEARGIAVGTAHLLADGRQVIASMGIRPGDVNVAVIPMSHSYGLGNLILPLVLQGTRLLIVEDPLPEPLRQAVSCADSLVFPGVPALFDMLSLLPASDAGFAGLRLCISAGAPLRPATAAAFRRRFGVPVRTFYGASESGGIAYDASGAGLAAEHEEGCVGSALPGVAVRLVGEEERIAVRSAAVAHGYLEEGHSRRGEGEFREGEFLTGDTGRFDKDGKLFLTGRLSAMVNVAGRKVNPLEVEVLLRRVPGVGDAAVLGVPDEARGESLVACLVARPEVTRESIMLRLRGELTAYKLPRRIVFLDEIPRTERGKIDRAALLRRAGHRGGAALRR
jgi:acyl-CoA synthetase (AMP-forming)/AMP-acid ligase II